MEIKKLYYAFVDLEKAVDKVLLNKEVIRWALSKVGIEELVSIVMAIQDGMLRSGTNRNQRGNQLTHGYKTVCVYTMLQ